MTAQEAGVLAALERFAACVAASGRVLVAGQQVLRLAARTVARLCQRALAAVASLVAHQLATVVAAVQWLATYLITLPDRFGTFPNRTVALTEALLCGLTRTRRACLTVTHIVARVFAARQIFAALAAARPLLVAAALRSRRRLAAVTTRLHHFRAWWAGAWMT